MTDSRPAMVLRRDVEDSWIESLRKVALETEFPMELRNEDGALVHCGVMPEYVTYMPVARGHMNAVPGVTLGYGVYEDQTHSQLRANKAFDMLTKDVPHATEKSMCYFLHVKKFKTLLGLSSDSVLQDGLRALLKDVHADSHLAYYIQQCLEVFQYIERLDSNKR